MKSLLPESAQFISLCKNAQDIKTANHNLYSILHSIDRSSDIQRAFIFGFEKKDQSEAIMNRMLKAAGNEIIKGDTL